MTHVYIVQKSVCGYEWDNDRVFYCEDSAKQYVLEQGKFEQEQDLFESEFRIQIHSVIE